MGVAKLDWGSHSGKYRPDIDGIRAIAVTSVVLCHAFPDYIPGGFIGVDIFFVISGYLITGILLKDCDSGNFSISKFYDRRIRRIFPALTVALLAILFIGWFCLFGPEFSLLGKHVAASTIFLENILLWSEVSYFDVSSSLKPTLHLWSLAIEEQFYIVWPIIIFFTNKYKIPFIWVASLLFLLSFSINILDIYANPTAAYYSPLGRSWELMAGSLLAYLQVRYPHSPVRHASMQSFIGIGMIAAGLALVRPESAFPGFWAFLPVGGAVLLIASGAQGWINRYVLATRPMVWCGLISYPLYLWHWVAIGYSNILFVGKSPVRAACCVLVSVVLAALTYLLIERPLRNNRLGKAYPFVLLACMIGVLAIALAAMTQVLRPRLRHFDVPEQNEWTFLQSINGNVGANVEAVYSLGGKRATSVLFIGDSHIAQYAVRLNRLLVADPARPDATLAIGGGCIPLIDVKTDDPMRKGCWPLRDQAYRMAGEQRFHRVVIGGAWNKYMLTDGYYFDDGHGRLPLNSAQGRKAALREMAQQVEAWQRAGKEVVFILDNPVSTLLSSTGWRTRFSLSQDHFPANSVIQVPAEQVSLRADLMAWALGEKMTVVDSFSAVCAGASCRMTSESGKPIFKDSSHFNPEWSIDHATFIDVTVSPTGHGKSR